MCLRCISEFPPANVTPTLWEWGFLLRFLGEWLVAELPAAAQSHTFRLTFLTYTHFSSPDWNTHNTERTQSWRGLRSETGPFWNSWYPSVVAVALASASSPRCPERTQANPSASHLWALLQSEVSPTEALLRQCSPWTSSLPGSPQTQLWADSFGSWFW